MDAIATMTDTTVDFEPFIPQESLHALFMEGGLLSCHLPGHKFRPEQLTMAEGVEEAFIGRRHGLLEAGTGTGKSFGYLIPAARAIARGKVVVVSTDTITLQSQLMAKDIPLLCRMFPDVDIRPYLLKGRGNYACLQDALAMEADIFTSVDDSWPKFKEWLRVTPTGDKADLPTPFSRWDEAASKRETCRKKKCPWKDSCFYYKARSGAYVANLIVVNHSLLMADLQAKRQSGGLEGNGEGILPHYDYLIVDEGHNLVDKATEAFSVQFDNHRIDGILHRLTRLIGQHQELRDRFSTDLINILWAQNQALFGLFNAPAMRSDEMFFQDAVPPGGKDYLPGLAIQIINGLSTLHLEATRAAETCPEEIAGFVEGTAGALESAVEDLDVLFRFNEVEDEDTAEPLPDEQHIRWVKRQLIKRGKAGAPDEYRVTLCHSPIEPGEYLRECLWSKVDSVVLTSATLATCDKGERHFKLFKSRLGLSQQEGKYVERIVDSPFDYPNNAVLYVPGHLPHPPQGEDHEYTKAISKEIQRIVGLSGGRAFVLFTSKRAMEAFRKTVPHDFAYPLFVQGEAPTGQLITEFRASGKGVLLGLASFWEGVDIQGDALSVVIIDRIPFAVPDSPLVKARTEKIKRRGGNWFGEYALPMAQIKLKQGFGRLIRTVDDRGVVAILDTRLRSKHYRWDLINSLPPAERAGTFEAVLSRVQQWGWGLAA